MKVGADSVLGEPGNGFPHLDAILDRARAGLAAEMLGTACEAFDRTLEYLKTREQFGQVIGSFQSLGSSRRHPVHGHGVCPLLRGSSTQGHRRG